VKFIVDAQLPKSLSDFLKSEGFDAIHTLEFPEKNKTKDSQIILKAITENRVVITKDNDFLDSYLLKSEPRKLVMVKTGNIPNPELIDIFRKNLNKIISMLSRSNLIEINRTEIIEQS
jgi:predicted nuclease of predicted toxin-antitoxin system